MATPSQTALVAHIEALNAKSRAWVAEDPANRFAGILTTDLAHWAESKIFSVEDFELYELRNDVWELYNSLYGVKPRFMGLWSMSREEVEAELASLREAYKYRQEAEAEAQEYQDDMQAAWRERDEAEAILAAWEADSVDPAEFYGFDKVA